MAFPVLEGWIASDSAGATVTSLTLTAPSGITADELLLIIVGSDDATDTIQFSTVETGWTKLGENANGGTSDCHVGVFYKIAGGSEGNVTIDHVSSDEIMGWYMRVSGVDTITPINTSLFGQAAANSYIIYPADSITTDVADCLLIMAGMSDGADMLPYSISNGVGWTEIDQHNSGDTGNDVGGGFYTSEKATAGGNVYLSLLQQASEGNAKALFAIAPATSNTIEADADATGESTTTGYSEAIKKADAEATGEAVVTGNAAAIIGTDASVGGVDTYHFDASISGPTDIDASWSNDVAGFDNNTVTSSAASANGWYGAKDLQAVGHSGPSSGGIISQVRARVYGGSWEVDNQKVVAEVLDVVLGYQDGSLYNVDNGIWVDDNNCLDGSLATYAYTPSASSYLRTRGNTMVVPASGFTDLYLRVYMASVDDASTIYGAIYSGVENVGDIPTHSSSTPAWTDYIKIDTPAGGWTQFKLDAIELNLRSAGTGEVRVYKLEWKLVLSSLGSPEIIGNYSSGAWGDYVTLATPAGGWTWEKTQSLEVSAYGQSDGLQWSHELYSVELEISTGVTGAVVEGQSAVVIAAEGLSVGESVVTGESAAIIAAEMTEEQTLVRTVDGHTSITDAQSVWTDDSLAANGSILDYAYCSTEGTSNSNQLVVKGIEGSDPGIGSDASKLISVKGRYYRLATGSGTPESRVIYRSPQGQLYQGSWYSLIPQWTSWSSFANELDQLSNGWADLTDISIEVYGIDPGTLTEVRLYAAEIEITWAAPVRGTSTALAVGEIASGEDGDANAAGTSTVLGVSSAIAKSDADSAGTSIALGESATIISGVAATTCIPNVDGQSVTIFAADADSAGTSVVDGESSYIVSANAASTDSSALVEADSGTISAAEISAAADSIADADSTVIFASEISADGVAVADADGSNAGVTTPADGESDGTSVALAVSSAIAGSLAESDGTSIALGVVSAVFLSTSSSDGSSETLGEGAAVFAANSSSDGSSEALGEAVSLVPGVAESDGTSTTQAQVSYIFNAVAEATCAATADILSAATSGAVAESTTIILINADAAAIWQTDTSSIGQATSSADSGAVVSTSFSSTATAIVLGLTPEIYEQEGYRFRYDDGTEITANWIDLQDTDVSIDKNVCTRLRILTVVSGDPAARQLTLQYREVGGGASDWRNV